MPKFKNSNATFWVIFKHCAFWLEALNWAQEVKDPISSQFQVPKEEWMKQERRKKKFSSLLILSACFHLLSKTEKGLRRLQGFPWDFRIVHAVSYPPFLCCAYHVPKQPRDPLHLPKCEDKHCGFLSSSFGGKKAWQVNVIRRPPTGKINKIWAKNG